MHVVDVESARLQLHRPRTRDAIRSALAAIGWMGNVRVTQPRDVVAHGGIEHREERGDHRVVARQIALGLRAAAQALLERALSAMQRPQFACKCRVESGDVGVRRRRFEPVFAHEPTIVVQLRVTRVT
jgi:hypothetical protein